MKILYRLCGGLVLAVGTWALLTLGQADYRATGSSAVAFSGVYIQTPDPERLARFHQQVFGGEILPAAAGTTQAATVRLRTPGYHGQGPVLTFARPQAAVGRGPLHAGELGYAHLCYEVEDVGAALARIRQQGGTLLSRFEAPHKAPVLYATDPDGNVLEVHIPLPAPLTPATLLRSVTALIRTRLGAAPARDRRRLLHVNLNVRDWTRALAFYRQAFGATPTGLTRNYQGEFIERLTGLKAATVQGRHAALPGYSAGGPTVEIFTYKPEAPRSPPDTNAIGPVAIEFVAGDLEAAAGKIIQAGGRFVRAEASRTQWLADAGGNLIRLLPRGQPR